MEIDIAYVNTDDDSYENCMTAGSQGFRYVAYRGGIGYIIVSKIKLELSSEDDDIIQDELKEGRNRVTLPDGREIYIEY